MNKVMTLTFASSLSNLREINSSFDAGVLQIAYPGKNRNGSFISKETFERCIPTMFNCPIVSHYDRDTDSFGGHDMEVITNAEGELRLINLTTPLGVIPESANHWWGKVVEEDGTEREYLFAECLIWKRQEEYETLKRDENISHSMEITVKDGEVLDGVFYIYDFEFTAFAIIGVEPCFESSALHMFSAEDFKMQLNEMMQDLKDTYSLIISQKEIDNIHPQENSTEGGKRVLNEKMELAAKYGVDVNTLDFSIEEMSIEELTEKFEAMMDESNIQNEEPQPEEPEEAPVEEDNADEDFALNSNIIEEICRSFEGIVIDTEWGPWPRYQVADFDVEASEVYCWDCEDWLLYGFKYSMSGDNVVIEMESKRRMKYVIVEFDEGEQESPFAQTYSAMHKAIKDGSEFAEKYQTASDTINSLNEEVDELRKFKADAESAAAKAARDEVFEQFVDLDGIEAFEDLRDHCMDYEVSVIEEKCYAIRGRNGAAAKFSVENKRPKFKVEKSDSSDDEPYNGVFTEYGFQANN